MAERLISQPRRRRSWRTSLLTMTATTVGEARALVASASGSDDDDDDDGGAVSAVLRDGAEALAGRLENTGDAVLVREFAKFWSGNTICKKGAFVLSNDGPSNLNCMDALNARGLSCTCLDNFKKKSATWAFRVAQKTKTTGTPSKAIDVAKTLAITKIAPFELTRYATELRIVGEGTKPLTIEFIQDFELDGSNSTAKLESSTGSKAKLEKVYIENIDMDKAVRETGFFKTGLTNLTLKNCGLKDGSVAFLASLSSLTILNLEQNGFTSIPEEILLLRNLREVSLGGNSISTTITENEYRFISAIPSFNLDEQAAATSSNCAGVVKQAHKLQFCISDAAPATSVSGSSANGTNKYLVIGAIAGGLVIVILIIIILRRRASDRKQEAFVKQQTARSFPENTLSFDLSKDSHEPGINSTLVNDPIIITHRVPHNDVKVATCISRGGFGLVYSGTFNRRRVAIKRIRPELSAEIKYIEAFLKEICLMASLQHPRIVEFVGVAWDSLRNLCAVTEFMERGDLRDVLQSSKERNARLTWDGHKARIAMHIAEALTYLHSLSPKVIHRDLKSKNVLLDSDMTAKLSDFGVSRERRFEETHMTAGIGTAFWIAPEVLLGMDYDERADIFSFGVVLSEIDTDDYPYWNEKNPASGGKQQENVILRMVATGALRPEFSPTCPSAIVALGQSCLDVDPQKRPTAAEIVYCLQQLIRSSPLTTESAFSSNEW